MLKISFHLIITICMTGWLSAQQPRGDITGTVFDATTNEPLMGANILVLNSNSGAAADKNGVFLIENVVAGTYAVRADMIGYTSVTIPDVVVSPARPVRIEFQLKETVIEVSSVTVRPDYFTEVADKPVSTQIQSNEEIRRLPGGLEDVVRAVSILPGVAQVQAGRNDLIVRGGAPSENLYVVDGIEVPNINHFGTQGASGGPLSFINLDYVDYTSFSSGGFSVRYGDKLSSVLTLNLSEGRKDRIGGKATLSATQFGLNLEGPVSDEGSFIFSARRSYLDLIFKAAGFGFVPEYWDFLLKTDLKISVTDRIRLLGIAALDQTRFFNDTAEKRYTNSRILGNNQNIVIGGIGWRHLFKGGYTDLLLGQNITDFNFEQTDSLKNPLFTNDALEHESILTANLVYNLSEKTEITAGMQGKWIRLKNDLFLPAFTDNFGTRIAANTNIDTTALKAAAWFQINQAWGPVRITAGGRYDHFNLIEKAGAWSPRISIQVQPLLFTEINISLGRYHQAPSYIWVVSQENNSKLEQIQVDQIIVGLERMLRFDTKLSLEWYYKNYSKYPASQTRPYLIMANTGAGFGGSDEGWASFGVDPLISEGTGYARGAELFIQKRLSDVPVYGVMSVTWNETRFKALDGVSRPGSFDQRWIFNFGGGYVFSNTWEISFKYRFATGRPYTPYNEDLSKSAFLYNSERIRLNRITDIRVDRRWFIGKTVLITYVDLQNVFNRKIYDVPRYNAFDNTFEESGSIGILPSIGISFIF